MTDPSTNETTNYTRILKATSVITHSLKVNDIIMSNNSVTGVQNPINSSDAVTKYYVDNFSSSVGAAGPVDSIQITTGTTFNGVQAFLYTGSALVITNTLNCVSSGNTLSASSVITGMAGPTNPSDAVNLSYIDSSFISPVVLTTSTSSTSLTPAQIINTYIVRTVNNSSSIIQDILPTDVSVINYLSTQGYVTSGSYSFRFMYYYSGTSGSINLFGNFIPQGSFQYYNTPISVCTVFSGNIVEIVANISTLGVITYYVSKLSNVASTATLTNTGANVSDFVSYDTVTNNCFVVYPVLKTTVNSSSPNTYSYQQLRNKFIVRTGLTGDTTDTFDILSTFTSSSDWSMGSGQFRFTIQNVSSYNLQIGPSNPSEPTGWVYDETYNRRIGAGKNGYFSVVYTGTQLILYVLGIYSRNGG